MTEAQAIAAKRALSQARIARFGLMPLEREAWLAQIDAASLDTGIINAYRQRPEAGMRRKNGDST